MKLVELFLRDIDRHWTPRGKAKVPLHVIGSGALFLLTDYDRGTKDSDVLETADISPEISQQLKTLAGRGSELCKRYGIFLDVVRDAIPFLPQKAIFHHLSRFDDLTHFTVLVLDPADVLVSKLKPFRPRDVQDIAFLIGERLVSHETLLARFLLVVDYYAMDARADDLPAFVKNLHQIERDFFDVPETDIALPDWV